MGLLTDKIQVNIPFIMLYESYLDLFTRYKLNPEIGFDADALDRFTVSKVEAIVRPLHDCGLTITVHAPFMDLSPGSPDPQIRALTRQRLEKLLGLMPVLSPKTVVCHTGYDHRRYWHMRDIWIRNSLETWTWFGQEIRDLGAVMMLENVYERGPDDMLCLFERFQELEVGFCLDTGHQAVFSNAPLEEWIDAMGPYLGQLHLHDNLGMRDDHLALGRGNIDFHKLLDLLVSIEKFPQIITLEPHEKEAFWESLEYLERIWPW